MLKQPTENLKQVTKPSKNVYEILGIICREIIPDQYIFIQDNNPKHTGKICK